MSEIKDIAQEIYSKENTKSHQNLIDAIEKYQEKIENINFNNDQETYDVNA